MIYNYHSSPSVESSLWEDNGGNGQNEDIVLCRYSGIKQGQPDRLLWCLLTSSAGVTPAAAPAQTQQTQHQKKRIASCRAAGPLAKGWIGLVRKSSTPVLQIHECQPQVNSEQFPGDPIIH